MKAGRTLVELAQELDRQQNAKRDFVADTRAMRATVGLAMPEIVGTSTKEQAPAMLGMSLQGVDDVFTVTRHAAGQIAEWSGIPRPYWDRMAKEAPALLESNVNHWLAERPAPRMLRTLDGEARAFLSNRYRRIDNLDVAQVVLPVLSDVGDIRIESCELTPSRMYIKAVNRRLEGEVKRGDVVQAGIVISNSEIGSGRVSVQPLIFRLVCMNGMIASDFGVKANHVGSRLDIADETMAAELFRDDTIEADDNAILLKVRDVVRASMEQAGFTRMLDKMREATEQRIPDPLATIELTAKKFVLAEAEKAGLTKHLIEGGDLSRWGLLNAITRLSQDIPSYDRATELERMGGRVLDLTRDDWKVLAPAAA